MSNPTNASRMVVEQEAAIPIPNPASLSRITKYKTAFQNLEVTFASAGLYDPIGTYNQCDISADKRK